MHFYSAGESHGKALTAIINDYPSGIEVDTAIINNDLKKRQAGYGRGGRMSIEQDSVEIISGLRRGITIGSPISFIIKNRDWENWQDEMNPEKPDFKKTGDKNNAILNPRPGHADLPGFFKFGFDDIRNVIERSSARETAVRVACGSFAKIFLNLLGIKIYSFVESIGNIEIKKSKTISNEDIVLKADNSELRCPDAEATDLMIKEIKKAQSEKDTLGGRFVLKACGVPCGIGSYDRWDKRLDALLAFSLMSIPSVKAVETGEGIKCSTKSGLRAHDEIYYNSKNGFYRKTNNAGGIEGGMSNGEEIVTRVFVKPIPTTGAGLRTVNLKNKKPEVSLKERSDVCAVAAASIVGEAMMAITLAENIQNKFGYDCIKQIKINYNNYIESIKNY